MCRIYRFSQFLFIAACLGLPLAQGFCAPKISQTGVVLSPLSSGQFPIAVWQQEPSLARKYASAGINLYVGLWQGPTEQQLADLKAAGMPVVCDQNEVALKHLDDPTIVGWLQMDEPDNAQAIIDPATGKENGYGPCVPPANIVGIYQKWKAIDPSRPVMLGLGQGVANDAWYGRGNGSSLDDYKTYVNGGDILSYDVYPMAGLHDIDKLWYVAKGLDRLKAWSGGKKALWEAIECTDIGGDGGPTPEQVRSEVWMVLVHGATGILYFVHQFKPVEDDNELLDNAAMLSAVTQINKDVQSLAHVLQSPTIADGATINSSNSQIPIDILVKHYNGSVYILASGMRNGVSVGTFTVKGIRSDAVADVIGEGRTISVKDGTFSDNFAAYGDHTYEIH